MCILRILCVCRDYCVCGVMVVDFVFWWLDCCVYFDFEFFVF